MAKIIELNSISKAHPEGLIGKEVLMTIEKELKLLEAMIEEAFNKSQG